MMRLAIVMLFVGASVLSGCTSKKDVVEIEALYDRFQKKLAASDYSSAYGLMSPSYRSTTDISLFTSRFKRWGGIEFTRSKDSYVHSRGTNQFAINPGDAPAGTYRGNFELAVELVNGKFYLTGEITSITD